VTLLLNTTALQGSIVKIIDISLLLDAKTPIYPGSSGFEIKWEKQIKNQDGYNNSYLQCDTHIGTHVDAPFHFLNHGETIDQVSLDILVGPVMLVCFPEAEMITEKELEGLAINEGTKRLILKTKNSASVTSNRAWRSPNGAVALTRNAARWIVNQNLSLIGIDSLSIATPSESATTHQILLEAGVIILEGLSLLGVLPGKYQLVCLPLKLSGAEASPARAVLIECQEATLVKGDCPLNLNLLVQINGKHATL
jgi:arylformamidase